MWLLERSVERVDLTPARRQRQGAASGHPPCRCKECSCRCSTADPTYICWLCRDGIHWSGRSGAEPLAFRRDGGSL
jgi:hypothetical protein